jgi:hypothetical protein
MSRAIALFALFSLLLGPLGLWDAAGCCGSTDCCKAGLCPMRRAAGAATSDSPAAAKNAEVEAHCHGAAAKAATPPVQDAGTKCGAEARCSHPVQQANLTPSVRAVVATALRFVTPQVGRAAHFAERASVAIGFTSVPVEPPRTLA